MGNVCTASPEKQRPVLPTELEVGRRLEDDIARVASKKTKITVKMPIGDVPTSWPEQVQLGRLKTHIATELFPKHVSGPYTENLTLDETEIQLLFGGLVLEDVETLAALGVEDGAVIVVTWGICSVIHHHLFFCFPTLRSPCIHVQIARSRSAGM